MKWIFLTVIVVLLFISCSQELDNTIRISGEAQGTTYHITYVKANKLIYKETIDSIFRKIDSSLSTYVPVSIISRINKNDSGVSLDDHFVKVFNEAASVSKKVNGLFDVTVAP